MIEVVRTCTANHKDRYLMWQNLSGQNIAVIVKEKGKVLPRTGYESPEGE
jgi:hypothetical protein